MKQLRYIDATDEKQVLWLAGEFAALNDQQRSAVLALTHALGLIKIENWQMRVVMAVVNGSFSIARLFGRKPNRLLFNMVMMEKIRTKDPEGFKTMFAQMLAHMVSGKDTYDPRSAGGWSQAEMDMLIDALNLIGTREFQPTAEAASAIH